VIPVPDWICPKTVILPTVGPICHSVGDVKLFLESIWRDKMFELDESATPLKFN